jgi:hypothetical protein
MRSSFCLLICVLFFLFGGCKSDFRKKITDEIEKKCNKEDSCTMTLDMKNVTNFTWDKFYYFNIGTSLNEIDSCLGFHYEYWQDLSESIIFSLNGKIVYHENYPMENPSNNTKGGFTFNLPAKNSYTYENAIFSVSYLLKNGNKYYTLSNIKK